MRVIAGKAKGRKLQTIEGLATRPTTDRMKETLFNIIAFDIPECKFLDLFSGSGAIGIEALSRGAAQAVFVDSSGECQRTTRENLAHTKLEESARILPMDVSQALHRLAEEKITFDIIFMDPPYAGGLPEPALEMIVSGGLLAEDGYIIVEHGAKNTLVPAAGLCVLREKEYRTTTLTFLCLEDKIQ